MFRESCYLWVKALVPDSRRENAAVQALLKWLIDASQPVAPWDRGEPDSPAVASAKLR